MKNVIFFLSIISSVHTTFSAEAEQQQQALNKAFALAVETNNVSLQDSCILAGADINTRLSNGKTPVQYSYERASRAQGTAASRVTTLIHWGAKTDGCKEYQKGDLEKSIKTELEIYNRRMLLLRIREGQEKQDMLNKALKEAHTMCKLLEQAGAQLEDEHKEK